MAGRMKNPTISGEDGFISILIDDTYPANKKGVVVKGKKKTTEKYFMKTTGFDELKGYLYFTTYEAGVLDTDNEFMKSEDIDFMHNDLMKNMKSTRMADINHDMQRLDNVWLNEIYKEYDEDGKTIASKGSYYIGENEKLMQKAKDGKINGVSIMGRVEDIIDEPLSKSDNSLLNDIWNWLKPKGIKIKEENEMTKDETIELLKELGVLKDEEVTEETPEETPAEEVTEKPTEEAPEEVPEETVEKSVHDAIVKELEDIKAELEAVKQEKDTIEKSRSTKPNENAENQSLEDLIKEKNEKMMEKYNKRKG